MDESSFRRHLNAMQEAQVLAVDTETTGFNVKDGRDYAMGISVAYRLGPLGVVSGYFPFRHPSGNLEAQHLSELKAVLERSTLVFHNLKFDLHSLRTLAILPRGKVFDTLNIAHMLNEE